MLRSSRRLVDRYPGQFWLLIAGLFIMSAGGSMIWPFLLIYVSETLDLPLAAVALLVSVQSLASIASSFVAGPATDRAGRKLVLVASLAGSGVVYLLLVRAGSYLEFAVLMAVQGVSMPLFQVAADAMVADLVPPERRAEAYSINRIAGNAGFGLGPAVGGFLAATSYSLAFLGAAIGYFTSATLLVLRARETLRRGGRADASGGAGSTAPDASLPARGGAGTAAAGVATAAAGVATAAAGVATAAAGVAPAIDPHDDGLAFAEGRHVITAGDTPGGGYRRVLADRTYVAFAILIAIGFIAPSMLWILLAVYTKTNFGIPESLFGWIPTTNAAMCVFVQYPVTRITSRFRPLPVIAVGMGVFAVGVGSVALGTGFWSFWASMVVMTVGELMVMPTAATYVADRAPADLRGRYMSVYWLGHGVSRTVAPLAGGFLNDTVAPVAIWCGALAIGLASTVGLAAMALREGHRSGPEPVG